MNHGIVKMNSKEIKPKIYTWSIQETLVLHARCVIKQKQLGNHTSEAQSEKICLQGN